MPSASLAATISPNFVSLLAAILFDRGVTVRLGECGNSTGALALTWVILVISVLRFGTKHRLDFDASFLRHGSSPPLVDQAEGCGSFATTAMFGRRM